MPKTESVVRQSNRESTVSDETVISRIRKWYRTECGFEGHFDQAKLDRFYSTNYLRFHIKKAELYIKALITIGTKDRCNCFNTQLLITNITLLKLKLESHLQRQATVVHEVSDDDDDDVQIVCECHHRA